MTLPSTDSPATDSPATGIADSASAAASATPAAAAVVPASAPAAAPTAVTLPTADYQSLSVTSSSIPFWSTPLRAVWPFAVAIVAAAVIFTRLLPLLNGYHANLVGDCGVAIMLAVSLTVVNGFTGQFSIGHSGFLSIGGYCASALVFYGTYHLFGDLALHGGRFSGGDPHGPWITKGDALFVASLMAGGVLAAAIGWVVGLPSLRLRGDYLAIVTLGFCEIVRVILQSSGNQLGLDDSIGPGLVDPNDLEPVHRNFSQQLTHLGSAQGFTGTPAYATGFWIALAAVLTLLLTIRLKYSAYGRAMLSIREDEIAAQSVGVNITRLKVRAFMFSAFFAGIAGGLFAMRVGTISAGELGFQRSFEYVIMVVLGGMGSITGAAIAAVLLTLMPEWLRDPQPLGTWGWRVVAVLVVLIVWRNKRPLRPLLYLIGGAFLWDGLVSLFLYLPLHGHPNVRLSDYRMVLYALMLILMMIVRPQGLFGIHEIWDYLPARLQWWNRIPPNPAPDESEEAWTA